MEIFQTIWTILTTQNKILTNQIVIPLVFIEIPVIMFLFTTILNISTTKKQRFIYLIVVITCTILSNTIIPKQIAVFINMLFFPLFTILIFRTSLLKCILALIVPSGIAMLLDAIFAKTCLLIFKITLEQSRDTPIFRLSVTLTIYLTIYIIYKLAKHFNFNITLLDNMNKKNKYVLTINSIIGCIAIGTQFYLIGYYNEILPLFIVLLSLLSLLTYFFISIYSLSKTTQLQITTQSLEESQLYNKSLKILHDNNRAFKHDFSNIVQAIGRICFKQRYEWIKCVL